MTSAFGIGLTLISLTAFAVPYILETLKTIFNEVEVEGQAKNETLTLILDNETKTQYTILSFAGLNCVGFLGAFLLPNLKTDTSSIHNTTTPVLKWSLLRDPIFLVISLGNACSYSVVVFFMSHLAEAANDAEMGTKSQTILVSVMQGTMCFYYLPLGMLGDSQWLKRLVGKPKKVLYTTSTIGMAMVLVAIASATTLLEFVLATIFLSLFMAGTFIFSPLVFLDCYKNDFAAAVCFSCMFRCVFALGLIPIVGYVKTSSLPPNSHIYFLSAASGFWMVLWLLLDFLGVKAGRGNS